MTEEKKNVPLNPGFTQVVVWPGTIVGADRVDEFEAWLLSDLNVRGQYLEEILTNPDKSDFGNDVPDTGGRNDVFFTVHADDIPKFSHARFAYGMRWLEDVINPQNKGSHLYPARVQEYKSWDPTIPVDVLKQIRSGTKPNIQ